MKKKNKQAVEKSKPGSGTFKIYESESTIYRLTANSSNGAIFRRFFYNENVKLYVASFEEVKSDYNNLREMLTADLKNIRLSIGDRLQSQKEAVTEFKFRSTGGFFSIKKESSGYLLKIGDDEYIVSDEQKNLLKNCIYGLYDYLSKFVVGDTIDPLAFLRQQGIDVSDIEEELKKVNHQG